MRDFLCVMIESNLVERMHTSLQNHVQCKPLHQLVHLLRLRSIGCRWIWLLLGFKLRSNIWYDMLRYVRFYVRSDRIQPSCVRLSLAFSVFDIQSLNTHSLRWCDSLSRLFIVCCGTCCCRSRRLLFVWMPLKR